ncbi:hypothetical protein BRADI_1g62264v3 [Brachypodium distachyon]|uniref:Uncharacterized protein n=1 Tax=Brachypodium distachyon TaxID=15368 RepID=A0A2K2DT16_BRADI|nr:hypothetical protein BRADI_1g62264v3 [Brachypodium distachyon]
MEGNNRCCSWLVTGGVGDRERVDGIVGVAGAVVAVPEEEDAARGTLVELADEAGVGEEAAPRLAHGVGPEDGLGRQEGEDLREDVVRQLRSSLASLFTDVATYRNRANLPYVTTWHPQSHPVTISFVHARLRLMNRSELIPPSCTVSCTR